MLLVDVHAHIGSFKGYDLSESTLLAETREGGVDLALVSNIDGANVPGKTRNLPESEANAATVAFVRSYPARFRGLLWGRPDQGDASALEPFTGLRLRGAQADPIAAPTAALPPSDPLPGETLPGETLAGGTPAAPVAGPRWTRRLFVGLKLHPEMNGVPADDPAFDPYLRFAARHGYPVVAHCDGVVDEASPARLLALARRHPTVPVVLYHTGFQGPHEPAIAAAEEARQDGSATLWLETAQLPPAWALRAVERVGSRRVLFGTDATFYGRGHYARYRPLLEALERELSREALADVRYRNALALFGLLEGSTPGPASDVGADDARA